MKTSEEQLAELVVEYEILKTKYDELLTANKQLYSKVQEEKAKCETWEDCLNLVVEKFADKL